MTLSVTDDQNLLTQILHEKESIGGVHLSLLTSLVLFCCGVFDEELCTQRSVGLYRPKNTAVVLLDEAIMSAASELASELFATHEVFAQYRLIGCTKRICMSAMLRFVHM